MSPGLGWLGSDPVNGVRSTDQCVRVAIGLHYLSCPGARFCYGAVQEDVPDRL
jgi:hypothetical protein